MEIKNTLSQQQADRIASLEALIAQQNQQIQDLKVQEGKNEEKNYLYETLSARVIMENPINSREQLKNEKKEIKELKDKYKLKIAQLKFKYEGVINELKNLLQVAKVEKNVEKFEKQKSQEVVSDLVQQFEQMNVQQEDSKEEKKQNLKIIPDKRGKRTK